MDLSCRSTRRANLSKTCARKPPAASRRTSGRGAAAAPGCPSAASMASAPDIARLSPALARPGGCSEASQLGPC
eukprot:3624196-Alexandrium_andersonii.AAC.1